MTARYETFDFFPPMDDMKLTKHPSRQDSGEWYGNVEGVEQTCFLLMHEQAIAEIALELGKDELAGQYRKIIDKRIDALQSKMWVLKRDSFTVLTATPISPSRCAASRVF